MEAGVEGRPAKRALWVSCTLEKQIKALLNTQNSARGTDVLPQQPTTSLAPAALCGMCRFICMYLVYYIYSTSLIWIDWLSRYLLPLHLYSWMEPTVQHGDTNCNIMQLLISSKYSWQRKEMLLELNAVDQLNNSRCVNNQTKWPLHKYFSNVIYKWYISY